MMTSTLGFKKATLPEVAGSLNLSVEKVVNQTQPVITEFEGVMRLMQPLYLDDSGQVTYIVVNPGGAFFGEKYTQNVTVGADANLLLAAQGATRIYRTPKAPAEQELTFTVQANGRLEYIPEQTIAYRDADFRQAMNIVVEKGASVFTAENVTPGWDPEDVQFTYAGMQLRFDVRTPDGGRVATDNIRINPGQIGADINGIGYLEGYSHMGSVLVVGDHTGGDYADQVRQILDASGEMRAGVTSGTRHGVNWVMVRALARSTDDLNKLIYDVNEYDRAQTTGQGRLNLRRY